MDNRSSSQRVHIRYPASTLLDKLTAIFVCAIAIPASIGIAVLRRLRGENKDVPFGRDLLLSVIRNLSQVPLSVMRNVLVQSNIDPILNSNRFASCKQDLFEYVSRPNFEAYWLCQGTPGRRRAPRDCDVVLLHIHGGAYVLGNPCQNFTQMLCTAERVAEAGLSASVLSLQYSLAPESVFPRQLEEAVAAYKYLTSELNVNPQKIMLMGESAGGHLALSLVHELSSRRLPKPRGEVLVFPWVDLTNSSPSVTRNKYKDMLVKEDLDRAVNWLMGDGKARKEYAHLLNMSAGSKPENSQHWKQVLPDKTWVAVGTHDTFFDSIVAFVERAKQQGADVELDITEMVPHGWTAYIDGLDAKKYLSLGKDEPIGDEIMKAAAMFGKAIANMASQ